MQPMDLQVNIQQTAQVANELVGESKSTEQARRDQIRRETERRRREENTLGEENDPENKTHDESNAQEPPLSSDALFFYGDDSSPEPSSPEGARDKGLHLDVLS